MSNSVFVPKGSESGTFSATSSVQSDAAKVMNDIASLINNTKVASQAGGKRKSSSKKSSKKVKKSSSKKSSSKHSKKMSKEQWGGKRKSSKSQKKSSAPKKGSKKGSKVMKGGREMNEYMKNMLAIKAEIKRKDITVKDGIPLTKVVAAVISENNKDYSAAKKQLLEMVASGKIKDKLAKAQKEIEEKRAQKRSSKH